MPHNRFFLDSMFSQDAIVNLSSEEHHHLARVHRAKEGDLVELVNGRGQLAESTVLAMRKQDAELRICSVEEQPSPPPLILAQALPRMNHLEWIIEKGTELNATAFWLFPGIFSEKETLSDAQQKRLKNICIASMKQCGRLDLPSIDLKPPLLQWSPFSGTLLFGDTSEDAPYLWEASLAKPLPSPVVIFIGPEKGFDQREVSFLTHTLKARGIRLHRNILRAETAPLAALAQLQYLL